MVPGTFSVSDIRFGSLPIDELRFPLGNSLAALLKDIFVPGGGFDGFRSRAMSSHRDSIAARFSWRLMSLRGRLKDMGSCIPQDRTDSNPSHSNCFLDEIRFTRDERRLLADRNILRPSDDLDWLEDRVLRTF